MSIIYNCIYAEAYVSIYTEEESIVFELVPNQELSGAKSELQGETVGVCSFYKWGGQPSYNVPARPPSVYTTKPASVFICTFQ